jgi:predicted acyl esterase
MYHLLKRMRVLLLLAVGAVLLAGVPPQAQAASAVNVTTYSVPVTTPDSLGNPVTIETDVYVPDRNPPQGGFPFIEVFHGGGSNKDNGFDAGHARAFAENGYVSLIYSARGHGNSTGQVTVAGPAEIRDLFDVSAWALGIGGRTSPAHPDFHIDRTRIALTGYSQGGLHTNLGQVWSSDPSINPYGISFRALEPGNTPNIVFPSLVTNNVVKLSFGVGLIETYLIGSSARIAPVVGKWIATATADVPQGYGSGSLCDFSTHDTATSSMQQDLAWRSVGCQLDRVALPWHWAQAFDDGLFPPEMAIWMWNRAPNRAQHRLYLSMGGHAAPAADAAVEQDKFDVQKRFMDAVMQGRPLPKPYVVYWTRDTGVQVPANSYQYPSGAWYRQTAAGWPPANTVPGQTYRLGANGDATQGSASSGTTYLSPLTEDEANDPVAAAAMSATPLGTTPLSSVPATNLPGFIQTFRTPAFTSDQELSGTPYANLAWTPAALDSQLVLELFDEAPSGKLTLFSRGVMGLRGATPGTEQTVKVAGNAFSIRLPAGHRVVAWVMGGNPAFYKPYPDSVGGLLRMGDASTLTLPLRMAPAR